MPFKYLEPRSVSEAVALLTKHESSARLIANGTDLINQMRLQVRTPEVVIDLGYIPSLDTVSVSDDGGLVLGAMATGRKIERNPHVQKQFPVIARCAAHLGSKAIRNMATIGGTLCNASPAADMPPGLLVHEAVVTVTGKAGERRIPVHEFFKGPGHTAMSGDEILTAINMPRPPDGAVGYFMKHSIKGTSDLAFVSVAGLFVERGGEFTDVRIALGAVGPTPLRARNAEKALLGKPVNDATIAAAGDAAAAECSPIDDVRCSADYRRQLVKVYVKNVIDIALGRSQHLP